LPNTFSTKHWCWSAAGSNDTKLWEDYIDVDWGPGVDAQHVLSYPDLEGPPRVVNIGWPGVQLILTSGSRCFLPARMADPFISSGRHDRVMESPEYTHPAYMVYPQETEKAFLEQALQGLRALAGSLCGDSRGFGFIPAIT
jgi:hypothetical protein